MAEQIRDSALAASGLLNRTIGGPSVKPYQPAGLWEQSGTGKTYTQDTGLKLYRRSLYTFWRRTSPPPSMMTFDAVSREVCTAKTRRHGDAAAGARAAERPAVRRGGTGARRAAARSVFRRAETAIANREAFRALTGRDAGRDRGAHTCAALRRAEGPVRAGTSTMRPGGLASAIRRGTRHCRAPTSPR